MGSALKKFSVIKKIDKIQINLVCSFMNSIEGFNEYDVFISERNSTDFFGYSDKRTSLENLVEKKIKQQLIDICLDACEQDQELIDDLYEMNNKDLTVIGSCISRSIVFHITNAPQEYIWSVNRFVLGENSVFIKRWGEKILENSSRSFHDPLVARFVELRIISDIVEKMNTYEVSIHLKNILNQRKKTIELETKFQSETLKVFKEISKLN